MGTRTRTHTHTHTSTVEERYLTALKDARMLGEKIKERNSSRANAVSLTELESAWLWARKDLEEKAQVI